MGRLKGYAKSSDIMNINISFGKEQYVFNLYEEAVVSEVVINKEIKEQPTSYAFLTMLQTRLNRVVADAEKEMEKKYSEVYNRYKEKVNDATGRVYDKDYASHIANANPGYQRKKEAFIKAKEDLGIVSTCVKAFEQRAFLIQTLSANIRKEK